MKLDGFFQNAYVTRDLDHAVAAMQAKHGIGDFIRIEPKMSAWTREGGQADCHLQVALGWKGDFLFELIQPISGNVQHYLDYLPADPGDPGLMLHHLGLLIPDEAEYARARAAIDGSYKPASRALPGALATGKVDLQRVHAETQNVIGVVPGSGTLAKELVVLGAHYDHLGMGGSGSMRPDVTEIHNGADDNASGVAGVLCASRSLLAAPEEAERRSVVVVAFSAEEIGLGGSAWYVQNPAVGAIADVAAMVNLDMVGRLREGKLAVLGSDSSPGWAEILGVAQAAVPTLTVQSGGDGYGPSDHSSFYGAGVPVTHLFTGAHEQYHTPEDDADLLNNEGGAQVIALTAALVAGTAHGPRLPYARTTASAPTTGDSRGYGAWFGSVPDYTAMEGATGGVKISDVRP